MVLTSYLSLDVVQFIGLSRVTTLVGVDFASEFLSGKLQDATHSQA